MSSKTAETSRPAPVVLPKGVTGVRSWRRERMKKQKRQRRLVAAVLFLAVLIAAVLVGMESPAGDRPAAKVPVTAPPPSVGPMPVLFAVTGPSSEAVDIAVVLPLQSGQGGAILAIPSDTVTEVVPGGAQTVSVSSISTPNAPGYQKLSSTIENMLGISIGATVVVSFTDLESMLSGAGALEVSLPAPIAPPPSTQGASFPAGTVRVTPSQVKDFLSDTSAQGGIEQAVRFGDLLQSWIHAVGKDPSVAPGRSSEIAGSAALGVSLVHLSKGAQDVVALPVDEIPAESPGASVEYQVNEAKLSGMLPDLVPGQPAALEPRPKIQLLNGTGGLGLDEEALVKLEPWVKVTLSGNACSPKGTSAKIVCFGYPRTEIITYDSRGASSAERVKELLGTGKILASRGGSDIVDMTVIVGADFNVSG